MVVEIGEATGQDINTEAPSSEASKILGEAETIAEQRVKEKFPDFTSMEPDSTQASNYRTREQSQT
jgi:division protein CdvB (Snf7/Vps24/ESCRT-III family)